MCFIIKVITLSLFLYILRNKLSNYVVYFEASFLYLQKNPFMKFDNFIIVRMIEIILMMRSITIMPSMLNCFLLR